MRQPLALVMYEKILPGSQLVNRLQDTGYRVQVVPAGADLVRLAEEHKPLVVFVDLASGAVPPCDLIARLRKTPATGHLPVIAYAPEGESGLQASARAAGATLVVNETAVMTHLDQFLDQALHVD